MENTQNINFFQIANMTKEEKEKMYMKLSKKRLIEMLIESNRIIDQLLGGPTVSTDNIKMMVSNSMTTSELESFKEK